jgi:MFS family permease
LLVRLVANKSSDKYGRVIILIYSALILVASLLVLSFAHTLTMVLLGAAIFGISWGTVGPTITAWTVDLCQAENRGRAIGSMYIALEAGIGLGALFSGMIYQNQTANFKNAFLLSGFLALVGFLLLFIWRKKHGHKVAAFQYEAISE